MARRIWFIWHSWLGLTAGLMLFVLCSSGTVAVFAYEIDWLLNPDLRAATQDGPVPFAAAHEAVAAAYPDWTITTVNAPRHPGFAMEVWADTPAGVTNRVFVDPLTHEILGDSSYLNVQRFFRSFHMALFQAEFVSVFGIPIGYFIVLMFAFPLLASLVTPLVFYRRWWRGFFKLETNKGAKVFWSDVHKLAGVWSLWFVALICLTSFWYLAEWFIDGPALPDPPPFAAERPVNIETWLASAKAALPELQPNSVSFFGIEDNVIHVYGHDGTPLTRGRALVTLDARNGDALGVYSQGQSGPVELVRQMADPLHFGTFAGLWSQALYFLFGLLLSGLALTGAYLQARRQARRHSPSRLRTPILAAYVVTIGLLLITGVAGWIEITGYSAEGGWPNTNSAATVFIFAWIAATVAAVTIWMAKLR